MKRIIALAIVIATGCFWAQAASLPVGGSTTSPKVMIDTHSNSVDAHSSKQNRVTGVCSAGYYVMSINADGTVVCGVDDGSGDASNKLDKVVFDNRSGHIPRQKVNPDSSPTFITTWLCGEDGQLYPVFIDSGGNIGTGEPFGNCSGSIGTGSSSSTVSFANLTSFYRKSAHSIYSANRQAQRLADLAAFAAYTSNDRATVAFVTSSVTSHNASGSAHSGSFVAAGTAVLNAHFNSYSASRQAEKLAADARHSNYSTATQGKLNSKSPLFANQTTLEKLSTAADGSITATYGFSWPTVDGTNAIIIDNSGVYIGPRTRGTFFFQNISSAWYGCIQDNVCRKAIY